MYKAFFINKFWRIHGFYEIKIKGNSQYQQNKFLD